MAQPPSARVLVLGGAGTAGAAYARELARAGNEVAATIRPGGDAGGIVAAGAKPVEVDLHYRDAVFELMEGIEVVVISLLGRGDDPAGDEEEITYNAIEAARRRSVPHLIYSSVLHADRPTEVPHFEVKRRLEPLVREAVPRHTVLRPATFMDGLAAPWFRAGIDTERALVTPIAPDVRISYVATADLGVAAARAISDQRLHDRSLDFGGPTAPTQPELAALIGDAIGDPVEYRRLSLEVIEPQIGPDLASMIRHFNTHGFSIDPDVVAHELELRLTHVESFVADAYRPGGPP